MNSVCIKFIGKEEINYIIQILEFFEIDVYISYYRFKIYDNLIIHYNSQDISKKNFESLLVEIFVKIIEIFYEEKIIRNIINKNYFYLSQLEREYICEISKKVLSLPDEKIGEKRKILKEILAKYINDNNKIYFNGFVNFRIFEYKDIIDRIVEISVFSYLDLNTF